MPGCHRGFHSDCSVAPQKGYITGSTYPYAVWDIKENLAKPDLLPSHLLPSFVLLFIGSKKDISVTLTLPAVLHRMCHWSLEEMEGRVCILSVV